MLVLDNLEQVTRAVSEGQAPNAYSHQVFGETLLSHQGRCFFYRDSSGQFLFGVDAGATSRTKSGKFVH